MEAIVRAPGFLPATRSAVLFTSLPLRTPTSVDLPLGQFCGRSRSLSAAAARAQMAAPSDPPVKGAESFFRTILSAMEKVYLSRNPTAKAIMDLVHSCDGSQVCYDHFAFRTFGVDDHGIDSLAKVFLDFGYERREELKFPAKKLRALWFAPPDADHCDSANYFSGPLPRIFISELLVDELSSQNQDPKPNRAKGRRCEKRLKSSTEENSKQRKGKAPKSYGSSEPSEHVGTVSTQESVAVIQNLVQQSTLFPPVYGKDGSKEPSQRCGNVSTQESVALNQNWYIKDHVLHWYMGWMTVCFGLVWGDAEQLRRS